MVGCVIAFGREHVCCEGEGVRDWGIIVFGGFDEIVPFEDQ